ncbi:MAG: glycosyltransferase family 2 protein [Treponemataceae bacterium]
MFSPKYSIVLPTLNSVKYLPSCVQTILRQNYDNYELIISNNCSDDGTAEYLETLRNNPRVKIIQPEKRLPLGDHWDFAISHAQGEWVYGIGSDDGVMPYFFNLLDILTAIADKKVVNIIKSNRAYFFWGGLQEIHGDAYINYYASPNIEIKSTKQILYEVLYENSDKFFDIPQMYTTSTFRNTLVQRMRNKRNGRLIQKGMAHDTYLGLVGCIYENKYLYSNIPIAWVGSSATSIGSNIEEFRRKEDEFELIKAFIKDNPKAYYEEYRYVQPALKVNNLLLARAILCFLRSDYDIFFPPELNITTHKNLVKFYALVYLKINNSKNNQDKRMFFFNDMMKHLGIEKAEIISAYNKLLKSEKQCTNLFKRIVLKLRRCILRVLKIKSNVQNQFIIKQDYGDEDNFKDMQEVNQYIAVNETILKIIDSIK